MRPSQKQNRARGRGSRNKPSGNVVNRVFESAGPEGKVRGTPQQIFDKYLTLSRDAQTSGDRVMSENFLQHAEHYQRILLEAQGYRDEQRRDQRPDQDGDDGDDRDDRDDSGRDDSGRDDSGRDEVGSDEAEEVQSSRQRDQRRDQPRDQARDERPQREDRPNGEQRAQQGGRQRGGKGGGRRDEGHDETEVSGLTTIDSGSDDGGSLLVEADEMSASQPPRRRRNQRRDRGQDGEQASEKSEADAQTE